MEDHKQHIPKILDQTEKIKNKILQGKVRKIEKEEEPFAITGRAEQIYLRNTREEAYQQKIKNTIAINEILQGEEGVDFVNPDEEWEDKIEEELDYGNERIEQIYNQMNGYEDQNNPKYANIAVWRKMNKAFDPIEEELFNNIPRYKYPGSEKGPHPEDDPEHFVNWFIKTYPKETVEGFIEASEVLRPVSDENQQEFDKPYPTQYYSAADEAFQPCDNRSLTKIDLEDMLAEANGNQVIRSMLGDGEIEPVPESLPIHNLRMWEYLEKWYTFRFTTLAVSAFRKMSQPNIKPKGKLAEHVNITSLYPYYATLPQIVRDHQSVKTAYKALEFTKHNLTIEQKEKALNYVCRAVLELDEVSATAMKDLGQTRRFYPTVDDERILIHEMENNLIDGYLTPVERDKYLQSKPIFPDMDPPEGEYPYPYPKRFETEDSDRTPVDYYQNDDGFWDDYIKEKFKRYVKAHRPCGREFFKH